MELYRVCKKDEMDSIFNNIDMSKVGRKCSKSCLNTHNYDLNKRYLHFFTKFYDIFHLNLHEGYYICEYNIPEYILDGNFGTGVYTDLFSFKKSVNVGEYAVPNELIDFDYLVKVYRIKEYMDEDDYIFDDIDGKIELIYRNGFKKYEKTLC